MKKTILTFILFTHFSCIESTNTNCLYQVNNERLYVKSVYWGLNGNSRTVKISQTPTGTTIKRSVNVPKTFQF